LNMYEEKGVSFLLDRDDTMQEYEATGKRKREEALARSEGAESNFMQKMGHIEQIEILHGLNEMTSGLQAFLVSPLPWKPMFSESWGERLVIC
jgi:E3 ubiquitin-protein ligase UBR7